MRFWRLWSGGLVLTLVVFISCAIGLAQVEIPFPWTQTGTYTGDAIDFGAVPIGTTKTATYTFKILETSATSATVTITRPNVPFGSDAPIGSFVLAPGQSRTFNVTFTPPSVGNYTGSFTITAQGGWPPQVKKQTVTLTGQGVIGTEYQPPDEAPTITWPGLPTTVPTTTEDTAKLETKLDTVGSVLAELRKKLDNLGWWLGKLTVGYPIGIEPYSTNPMPETDLWRLLASLEAKLDRLAQQPSEVTAPDINIMIIEIYNIIVEINQFIINLGGNVAKLEAKLDRLAQQPTDVTITEINITITEIYNTIVAINQLLVQFINVQQVDVSKLETKLDKLEVKLDDLQVTFDDFKDWFDTRLDWLKDDLVRDFEIMISDHWKKEKVYHKGNNWMLLNSNNRIEDKLNRLLGLPVAPDASKIAVTVAGLPTLAAVPLVVTVTGSPGAVQPGALVSVYAALHQTPNRAPGVVLAEADGSFALTLEQELVGLDADWNGFLQVTQTVNNEESAPVLIAVPQ